MLSGLRSRPVLVLHTLRLNPARSISIFARHLHLHPSPSLVVVVVVAMAPNLASTSDTWPHPLKDRVPVPVPVSVPAPVTAMSALTIDASTSSSTSTSTLPAPTGARLSRRARRRERFAPPSTSPSAPPPNHLNPSSFHRVRTMSTISSSQTTATASSEESPRDGQPNPNNPSRSRRRVRKTRRLNGTNQDQSQDDIDVVEPSSEDDSVSLLAAISSSSSHNLSSEIHQLYQSQQASPAALKNRRDLIHRLNNVFNSASFRWGHLHSPNRNPIVVEPFGSVRFGLATSSSDLDLCLFDPYRPNGFERGLPSNSRSSPNKERLPDIYNMQLIAKELYHAGFFDILPLPYANVPIVKFKAKVNGEVISADINTNERLGVLNSRLINAYCDLSHVVRPLSVFVKFWARQRRLNDPSGSQGPISFSSYTLILLVISFLQIRGILPNLQDAETIALSGMERKTFTSRPKSRTSYHKSRSFVKWTLGNRCDVTFIDRLPGWMTTGDLAELAHDFFEFYADRFDFDRSVVSIVNGQPFARRTPFKERQPHVPVEVVDAKKEKENGIEDNSAADADGVTATDEVLEPEPTKPQETGATQPPLPLLLPEAEAEAEAEATETPHKYFHFDPPSTANLPEFVEPGSWVQKLIVQDPFVLSRNTAVNVQSDVVDVFRKELLRAKNLIAQNSPLSVICASIKNEPDYQSLATQRRQARKQKVMSVNIAKQKFMDMAESSSQVPAPAIGKQQIPPEES